MVRRHGVAWRGTEPGIWCPIPPLPVTRGEARILCDAYATYFMPTRVTPKLREDVGLLVAVHCEDGSMLMRVVWPRHSTGELRNKGERDAISTASHSF